ncbi:hypothetical protein ACYOEI_31940 [Singulisphaera rosea]
MILFTRRRDEPFRLLTSAEADGRLTFDHYATIVPVKIRGRHVETCFLTRWDINVVRARAGGMASRAPARPGEPGYRRFLNLKLTLTPDDPVRIRPYDFGLEGESGVLHPGLDVVVRVLDSGQGRVEFSVSTPPDQIVDLTQFDSQQGAEIREMIVRLNHGDAWDRVESL